MKLNDFSQKPKRNLNEMHDCGQDHELDHEVNMAKADLYKLANYAAKLHDMLTNISEQEGLQGWQQAKITKAADYISAVYHSLDYDQKFEEAKATKTRLDPSCWDGKKIGNPKTKVKGGVRVNNCVPEGLEEAESVDINGDPQDPRNTPGSAFSSGWSDGWHDNKNPRASSSYGPGVDDYYDGVKAGKQARAKHDAKKREELDAISKKYDAMSTEELKQVLDDYVERGEQEAREYEERRRALGGRYPPGKSSAELIARNKEMKTMDIIHRILSSRGEEWKLKPRTEEDIQQVQELNIGKAVKRVVTGSDLNSRIEKELNLADQAFRYGDVSTGKEHFNRYMRLIKLSQGQTHRAMGEDKKKRAVVQTSEPVGFRVAGIGPGGKEHNVKTDAAWDKKNKKEDPEQIDELFGFGKKKTAMPPRKTLGSISTKPTPKFGSIDKTQATYINLDNVTTEKDLMQKWQAIGKLQTQDPTGANRVAHQRAKGAIIKKADELGFKIRGINESKTPKGKKPRV